MSGEVLDTGHVERGFEAGMLGNGNGIGEGRLALGCVDDNGLRCGGLTDGWEEDIGSVVDAVL